ncbi:plexin-C1 [Mixophyes fleayi]|uniref:plexin-C1 n=1 Tax=Mixophyes fleayi TaxID=3061075 RepID=UPI003F4DF65A
MLMSADRAHTVPIDLTPGKQLYRMSSTHSASIIFSILVSLLATDPVSSEGSFAFEFPVNNIAVGRQYVIVATENCLYQFNHTLNKLKSSGPRGVNGTECTKRGQMGSISTYYNKILLVYGDTVLSCWNENKGFCRVRSITELTALTKPTECIVPSEPEYAATGLTFFKDNFFYLIVATFTRGHCPRTERPIQIRKIESGEFTDKNTFVLLNGTTTALHFVDAFQWKQHFIFPYYQTHSTGARIVVMHVVDENNQLSFNFDSQSNLICGRKTQSEAILSSFSFTSSGGDFWAGIFSTNKTVSPDRTALCVYNFSVLDNRSKGCINNDFSVENYHDCTNYPDLLPLHEKPTLTHGDLSAVYAMEVQKRLVFFLGTGNGQLLKVTLNSNYTANCPEVLYEFKNEAAVFRTIHLDPIDKNYLYVATVNEIKRLKIAKCEQYESCNECLSATDPHCGWCQSKKRCTMNTECEASSALGDWIGISEEFGKCLGIHVVAADQREIRIDIKKNPSLLGKNTPWNCEVKNMDTKEILCLGQSTSSPVNCSCQFPANKSPESEHISVEATSNTRTVSADFQFKRCSQYSKFSCFDCISSGCLWCTKDSTCISPLTPLTQCEHYADEAKCKSIEERTVQSSSTNVSIHSVIPSRVTSAGKKNVLIIGNNLQNLTRMFLFGTRNCKPQEVKVTYVQNSTHAFMSLPQSQKEIKRLCVDFDQKCYQGDIFYESLPSCSVNFPNSVWHSGGRNLSISGRNLDFKDNLTISRNTFLYNNIECSGNNTHCYFTAPQLHDISQNYNININIEESSVKCGELLYRNNPIFRNFAVLNDVVGEIELRIKKTRDELHIQANEIEVIINYAEKKLICEVQNITENVDGNTIFCKAKKDFREKIDASKMNVKVILGKFAITLEQDAQMSSFYLYILLVIPLLLIVAIAACLITRYKSKQLSNRLSKQLEQLECDIRQEIRDGFAEFQIDKEVVTVDTLGTIPFFDYKHFAVNTLFPESDKSRQDLCEKLCENVPSPFQARKTEEEQEIVTSLNTIFESQGFLVLLIHTLEKQSDFSVKDRCMFASFLTINFQSNLLYLTGLLEVLIKDLMEQSSNKHPKLMLRRTETVVEKLLTNWMSTCLYGYLRESVGEPLYGLVHTLNQRIHKGPIDAITCKALYTLNEDWLLWQITEFSNVEISVHFPMTSEHESEQDVSQSVNVTVLDCDSIGQVKEKILQTFLTLKGYHFGVTLCDIGLELHHGQTYKELSDIDDSTVTMENGVRRLNTIKHYKIENGATIKVIPKKNCDLQDTEYSNDYIHLEISESEESEDLKNMENKGKQKFKVKELYLTKLLSTKVSIHSAVEKLFRSIWTIQHNKPPVAIKYFFDFLDTQGEIKKITDPDVMHIWKTNSLPLRFWVNILKNPQFVLDIKKTPLLDSCLSVITQAFMDGFSLAEQQLGKSAPTNKLLYAKEIPLYKEEIKAYYNEIRDASPLSSTELTEFLTMESMKHEHEFKEDVAMLELYKYIEKYYNVIITTLEKETGFDNELKQLLHLKKLIADRKKCTWE